MVRPQSAPAPEGYARYVLGVLVVVYVFNFLDRQIISILAERIRADLGVSDAELGFLYGTAFAVFFAAFGIPLGRLADVWDRRKLIAVGLAVWSLMTALSGFARSFPELALARIGVGIGEASAAPAAYSLLSDYFPPARRATALAVYSSGIYLGAGLGLVVGGLVVDRWEAAFPVAAPFGLRGWQVAFFVVGLPGLLLALWVRTLREPTRGAREGLVATSAVRPLHAFLSELRAVLPPLTLIHLALAGAGTRGIVRNLVAAAIIAVVATVLTWTLGSAVQWIALGIGVYAAVSWLQALALRDPPTLALITGSPTLRYAGVGFALLAFVGYGIGFWLPTLFMRAFGTQAGRTGLILGVVSAVGGWLGTTLGGVLADARRRRTPAGRLHVGAACPLLTIPLSSWMLLTHDPQLAFTLAFPVTLCSSLWIGPGASTIQDLVLPRMRGSASAAYLLLVTFIGLALGPYTVGRLSVATGDLRTAMLCALAAGAVGGILLLVAARHVGHDEATRVERARAAGESV